MDSSDPDRGSQIIIVASIFLGLAWISVLMRCFVRIHILRSFSVDDWLMLLALSSFTIYSSFLLVAVHNGLGRHNDSLPLNIEIKGMEFTNVSTMVYILTMAIVKSSIAVFLLRLSVTPIYHWILGISMVIVVLWSLGIFFFDVFTCSPVAFQWDTTLDGHCVSDGSIEAAALSFSIMGIASDWLYALLPIPIIWGVKMNIQTKVTVGFILSLGIFASVATLVRLKYLTDVADQGDFLYQCVDAGIWTNIEVGLSIVAASIVTLRPLLRALHVHGFSNDDTASNGRRNASIHLYGNWHSQRGGGTQISSQANDHEMDGMSQRELNGGRPKVSSSVSVTVDQRDVRSEDTDSSEELVLQGPRRTSIGGTPFNFE